MFHKSQQVQIQSANELHASITLKRGSSGFVSKAFAGRLHAVVSLNLLMIIKMETYCLSHEGGKSFPGLTLF